MAWVTNAIGGYTNTRTATLTVDPTFIKITAGAIVPDSEVSIEQRIVGIMKTTGGSDLFVVNPGTSRRPSQFPVPQPPRWHFQQGDDQCDQLHPDPSVSAGAWADFDNDGDEDLFVCNWRRPTRQSLPQRGGRGLYPVPHAVRSGVSDGVDSYDVAWVDYDRDGFLDLFVVELLATRRRMICLYRNNGSAVFTKMTAAQVGPIVLDSVQGEAVPGPMRTGTAIRMCGSNSVRR